MTAWLCVSPSLARHARPQQPSTITDTFNSGICEYAGVDPADVDILMGTFTKSFGVSTSIHIWTDDRLPAPAM
jgi:hypothetical protein